MKKFTVGSVFSGVGGLCGGFQDEGFEIAWQVELDDAARGVLDHLYPTVPKFKDIRDVGKNNLSPVDVLVGGFPCTDLSVAGARAGITGKSSGLFQEMMRVAEELQVPWVCWENVPGLLSSFSPCEDPPESLPEGSEDWEVEESSDFETVLRGLAERGYSGAWRILDAQLFGIPQRRERLFGVFTRLPLGAERAAEVLALKSSLRRHPPKGRKARADIAEPLTAGTGSRGHRIGAKDAANNHLVAFGRNNTSGPIGTAGALMGQCGGRNDFETETFIIQDCREGNKDQNGLGITKDGPVYTLQANNHIGVAMPQVIHYTHDYMQDRVYGVDSISPAICANQPGGSPAFMVPRVVVFPTNGVTDTLSATDGGPSVSNLGRVVCLTGDVTHTLTCQGSDASEDGTGRGTPIVAFGCKDSDPCGKGDPAATPTLRSRGEVAIAFGEHRDVKGTRLDTQEDLAYTLRNPGAGGRADQNTIVTPEYIVRRLTPLECERLMNWEDGTTMIRIRNGKPTVQADAPRYRQCGNGVVKACARYVARRLKKVMEK